MSKPTLKEKSKLLEDVISKLNLDQENLPFDAFSLKILLDRGLDTVLHCSRKKSNGAWRHSYELAIFHEGVDPVGFAESEYLSEAWLLAVGEALGVLPERLRPKKIVQRSEDFEDILL